MREPNTYFAADIWQDDAEDHTNQALGHILEMERGYGCL